MVFTLIPAPSWYAGQLQEKRMGRPVALSQRLTAGYATHKVKKVCFYVAHVSSRLRSSLARPVWRVRVWRGPVGRVPLRRDASLARDSLARIPVWRVAVRRVLPVCRVAVRRVLPVCRFVHFSRFLDKLTYSALHKEMNNVEMWRCYVTLRKN